MPQSYSYVKIHKFDHSGLNNDIALGQATKLKIKHTTLNEYVTIGNIISKTEYPTYWLYRVQSLGSNTADNYIKDYKVSASNHPITTLTANTFFTLKNYGNVAGNTEGFFTNGTGLYTTSQTSNVALQISASITTSGSQNGTTSFIYLKDNDEIIAIKSVSAGANITTTITGSYFPLPSSNLKLVFFNSTIFDTFDLILKSGSFLVTQSIAPTASVSCSVIIEPYITEPNFYNSDNNALLNSVSDQRPSTFALDVDYGYGTTPINFGLLASGSATAATVPDSNYTSKKSTLLKYEGSKSTSQFLNVWTQGDTGTYGKLPTVEILRNAFIIAGDIAGWPPEIEGASAVTVNYIVKEDGTLIKPWSTKNALQDLRQYFTDGERITISSLSPSYTSGSPTNYYKILKSGYQVQNILYTQIGQSPNQTFTASLSLIDKGNSATSLVQDYQVKVGSDYSSLEPWLNNSMTSIFEEINFPVVITSGSFAQTQPAINARRDPGVGNTTNIRYYVSQSLVDDKVDLTFNFKLLWSYSPQDSTYANPRPLKPTSIKAYYQLIRLRNGSETIIYDNPEGNELVYLNKIPFFFPVLGSFTVLSTNLNKDDIFYLKAKAQIQNKNNTQYMFIEAGSELNIIQNPIENTTISIENFWISASNRSPSAFSNAFSNEFGNEFPFPVTVDQINSGAFAGSNILYTTSSIFKNNFANNFAYGTNIPDSGFNPIGSYWNIIPGDEFKFEGKENQRYIVLKASVVTTPGSLLHSVLAVEFNKPLPISESINYDNFSIQRYIDFEGNLILEGFKPSVIGPFIVTPEFITPNLNKNIGKILEDLTSKGLIT